MRNFCCILELPACYISVLLAVSLCWGGTFCEGQTPHLVYLGCSIYLCLEVSGAPVMGTDHRLFQRVLNTPIHAAGFSLGCSELPDFLCSSSSSQGCENHIQISAECSKSLLSFQCSPLMTLIYLPPKSLDTFTQLVKKPCIKVSSQSEVSCVMLLDTQALNPDLYQEFPNFLSQSYPVVQNCLDFVWDTELILPAASSVFPTLTVLCVVSLQQFQLI